MANLFPSPGGVSIKDRVAQTMFLSLSFLERLCGTFMTKNCGATTTRVKMKLQKLRKCTHIGHNEHFIFHSIWFINESNIFKIF